ncbi:hypothetical protein GQ42DRAFT_155245 [Ramicandelaber brevisporus]|nr:hypothetical protein GQ42DRAFT_155245 [Ramicandelaber brevisporus]
MKRVESFANNPDFVPPKSGYLPGVCGYSPDFAPPKGTRRTLRPKKKSWSTKVLNPEFMNQPSRAGSPKKAKEAKAAHAAKTAAAATTAAAAAAPTAGSSAAGSDSASSERSALRTTATLITEKDPKMVKFIEWKHEMSDLRRKLGNTQLMQKTISGIQQDLSKVESNAARKRAVAKEATIRSEWITTQRDDPQSAYNILNDVGITVVPNMDPSPAIKDASRRQLTPDQRKQLADNANVAATERDQLRFANFVANRKELSERRLSGLIELFHQSATFVTFDNLEQKIEAFLASPAVSHYKTPSDLLLDMERASGGYQSADSVSALHANNDPERPKRVVSTTQVASRVVELANALDGTSGPFKQIGVDLIRDHVAK